MDESFCERAYEHARTVLKDSHERYLVSQLRDEHVLEFVKNNHYKGVKK